MKLLPKLAALAVAGFALSSFTGCTANNASEAKILEKTFPKPQDGYGGVYIYREFDIFGVGRAPALVIDNRNTVDIKNSSYYYTQLPEGMHTAFFVKYTTGVNELITETLTGETIKSAAVRFEVKSGNNYYIKVDYGDAYLDLVTEEEGQKGVSDCESLTQ